MAERPSSPEHPTPPARAAGDVGATTMLGSKPLAVADPQGRTPDRALDLDREQARAKLRANLFQIDSEPIKVGRYTILSRLGQGGMGVVYAAYDEDLDRKIAVKVVLPSHGSDTTRSRMRREAQAMARLSHPNIVTVHEVGEFGDQVFIAMEFVRGQSLDQWIDANPRPWAEVLEVYRQAGLGLDAAHQAGLVHRDFKPHNVMLGDDGSVKVLDFGLARDEGSVVPRPADAASNDRKALDGPLTKTGAIVGTPAYMSPEQHMGKATNARSDQFSFCVALFAGLHGHHPFEGETLPALVHSVCEGQLRPTDGSSRVPAWLDRVVRRGLSSDPLARFPSMEALLDALAEDPGARRRRRLTGLGTVALVFVGGFGVAQWAGVGSSEQACPPGEAQLRPAWDDERRQAITTAMREHPSARAEATWARVEPMLEGYAQTWVGAHDDSCRAHQAGTRSDLLYERGRACLDRSAEALRTTTEQLQAPDEAVLDKAVTAVAELPSIEHCRDPTVLLAELVPPEPAIASDVAEQRQRLSRAQTLENLGRLADSVTLANEVIEDAKGLEYAPLQAEALLQRGRARMWGGEGEAADADLGNAAWLAMKADHEVVAAEAAAKKVYARSELQGRPTEAAVELPWAEALIGNADDPVLRGLFLNNAAAVRARQGQGQAALELLQRALEVRRQALPPEHPDIALTLANLGRVQNEQGLVDEAVPTLQEAAQRLERALGPRHPQCALVATMLATALLEQG
ncbi:MAG: serine/threonine-protein kinase, partial [Myxococcota bacterium]